MENPAATDFELALGELQDHLPTTWATQDPASNIYALLLGLAALIDPLAALFEQPYLDQALATASTQGLIRNFAYAWGLTNETLPTFAAQLAAYIAARTLEDGSYQSLLSTLTALIDTPPNQGGPILTFPGGGGGLTFPAGGGGLTLYEWTSPPAPALTFPADGSGLVFPADGSGLILSSFEWVDVTINPATYTMTAKVLTFLAFDRQAFARAVNRFRPADWWPPTVVEVYTLP